MFFTGLANDLQGIDKKTRRPTKLISQGKQVGYFYDKHGRVKTKTLTPVDKDGVPLRQSSQSIVGYLESLQLFYTPNNELEKSIKIHQQGFEVITTTTNYYYDAFGRRIGKSSSTQKSSKLNQRAQLVRFPSNLSSLNTTDRPQRKNTLMLWDGNRQIQEITDDFIFTTVYEQNSFVPVARIVERQPHLLKQAKLDEQAEWAKYENMTLSPKAKANIHHKIHTGLRIYYYHTDHLGTPQELTNDRGEVVWLNYQMAWGGSFSQLNHVYNLDGLDVSSDELQPFRFQGQFFDGETGLHYNRFRYYDSDVGMFISRDPIGLLGGVNVFAYAPNPIHWIDPWGLANRPNNGKYKSYVTHTVPINDQYSSDSIQFRQANKALRAQLDNNQSFAQKMYKKYPKLETWTDMGKSPPGLTWHHHEDVRKLVLVDRKDHKANHGLYHPTGQGGRDIWGGGKPGREGKLDGKTGKLKNPCNSI